MISRVRNAELGFELRLRDLLRYQTIEALVASRDAGASEPVARPVALVEAEGDSPLTPIQAWFFGETIPARHHFNQSVLLQAGTAVDESALEWAIGQLNAHHDALRMRFRQQADRSWTQTYSAAGAVGVPRLQREILHRQGKLRKIKCQRRLFVCGACLARCHPTHPGPTGPAGLCQIEKCFEVRIQWHGRAPWCQLRAMRSDGRLGRMKVRGGS